MKTALFRKTMFALAIFGSLALGSDAAVAHKKASPAKAEAVHTKDASRQLVLHLAAKRSVIHLSSTLSMEDCIRVTIENRGTKTVKLVNPGEASDYGVRTPIIGISLLSANDTGARHPDTPPRNTAKRCGNFDPKVSLFTLAPGQKREIGDLTGLFDPFERQLKGKGPFRAVFYYINDPKLWESSGGSRPRNLKFLESTPCVLRSNEIILNIAVNHARSK